MTRKFAPGEKLPSGPELAKTFGVARQTIQQAVRELRDEGLIVSRQGSGVFVREKTARPVGLRPHIEEAFKRAHVSIDFAGFSGEPSTARCRKRSTTSGRDA
ncbi:winged helix-turn-helix domain-containing protein [Nonomuraea sp. NPDC055795]